jgi:hypothetical protein
MIKISTIFALGIFIALIPFSGFPNDSAFPVKNILYIVSGLLVTTLSILIRKDLEEVVKHLYTSGVKNDTFSESSPQRRRKTDIKDII